MSEPRREIEAAASRRSFTTMYAPCALDEAAALLADLPTGEGRTSGVPSAWAGEGTNLPDRALDTVASHYRQSFTVRTPDEVGAGYRRLETSLAEAGTAAVGTYRGRLLLPRLGATPPWGWSGEAALTVGLYVGEGWTLELAQERTPVIDLVAPTERAVAELVADILNGRRHDPFPHHG